MKIDTGFIPKNIIDLMGDNLQNHEESFALAAGVLSSSDFKIDDVFADESGWRLNLESSSKYYFQHKGEIICVSQYETSAGYFARVNDGNPIFISYTEDNTKIPTKETLKHFNSWHYKFDEDYVFLTTRGISLYVKRYQPEATSEAISSNTLTAPMPGKIIAVNAKAGGRQRQSWRPAYHYGSDEDGNDFRGTA